MEPKIWNRNSPAWNSKSKRLPDNRRYILSLSNLKNTNKRKKNSQGMKSLLKFTISFTLLLNFQLNRPNKSIPRLDNKSTETIPKDIVWPLEKRFQTYSPFTLNIYFKNTKICITTYSSYKHVNETKSKLFNREKILKFSPQPRPNKCPNRNKSKIPNHSKYNSLQKNRRTK